MPIERDSPPPVIVSSSGAMDNQLISTDRSAEMGGVRRASFEAEPAVVQSNPMALDQPQPVDAFIRLALAENRAVRAARMNILALEHRIPQVTTLDDPVVSNTIFPIPAVAPQFSLMGYMPYDMLLAQQFPWFGTLRLRGQVAEEDVKVAIMELAAVQLDTVASVKRAYHDLHYSEQAEALLQENRKLAVDFVEIARQRYKTGTATQVDLLRAEVAVSDVDRELELTRQGLNEARTELARLIHASPETEFQTLPQADTARVPDELDRLYQLASISRPDLRGRLATIARDQKAVELAQKRFYPNVSLGLVYQDMEKTNAMTPRTAGGMPNVGLFVGFNLPVHRSKYRAGVCEAQARLAADSLLYENERDQAHRDVKDLFVQATVQRNILELLRRVNRPAAQQAFELTANDYRVGNAGVDYLSVINAWRELLQIEIQIAQADAELGKSLALLERAVGLSISENPPDPTAISQPLPESSPSTPANPTAEPGAETNSNPVSPEALATPEPTTITEDDSKAGADPISASVPQEP
jgi:outer membrane protein TolC